MARLITPLDPRLHDGTSQRDRALPALDPAYARLDGRDTADLIRFVQRYVKQLRYFAVDEGTGEVTEQGTWEDFANPPAALGLTPEAIAAWIQRPERLDEAAARWLGRPHFALLLTFIELLGRARDQLNGLTERHLDFYFNEVLGAAPLPAEPDRVGVLFRLARGVPELRLPSGTEVQGGRDSAGKLRIYKTERDLVINRAEVADLRSVAVDRRVTGISDVRKDRSLTATEALDRMLKIALGAPGPGDAVPPWQGIAINRAFLASLRSPLGFAPTALHLSPAELHQLVDGWRDSNWPDVNLLIERAGRRVQPAGWVYAPTNPSAVAHNLCQAVGELLSEEWPWSLTTIPSVGERLTQYNSLLLSVEEHLSLSAAQLERLASFASQIEGETEAERFDWTEVDQLLACAHRQRHGETAVAQQIDWRDLHALADARLGLVPGAEPPRWRTFGQVPAPDPDRAPATIFGFALRSPLLALSQGTRALTLTLGFEAAGFEAVNLEALREHWRFEISTAAGWVELSVTSASLADGEGDQDYGRLTGSPLGAKKPAVQVTLTAPASCDAFAPLEGSEARWPTLRLTLRRRWAEGGWITPLTPYARLTLIGAHLGVQVAGLADLRIQAEERALDPGRPFEPFGAQPMAGSRLYISHRELVRNHLNTISFNIEWIGLPGSLRSHYQTYGTPYSDADPFKAQIRLIDRGQERPLALAAPLFTERDGRTLPTQRVQAQVAPTVGWSAAPELTPGKDLRGDARALVWELQPVDFGHGVWPALAAQKARALAVDLARKPAAGIDAATYQINPPYTPRIKRLTVDYSGAVALDPRAPTGEDQLLHLHPFGEAPVSTGACTLFPRYESAGELYIGLREAAPPRHLTLWFQLAEGTSGDTTEAPSWSALSGDVWLPIEVISDGTGGLLHTGVLELALPAIRPSTLLPAGLTWIRVAIASDGRAVCDTIQLRTQAVMARFDDRGNAPDHAERPLPAGSVSRLHRPDARITAVEQPCPSVGGRPTERPDQVRLRFSERLRHRQRALTPVDYERLVLQRFPQLYKVCCLPATTPGRVELVVMPDLRQGAVGATLEPRVGADLLAEVRAWVRERAPASADIVVRNPDYVPLTVRLGVRFKAGLDALAAARQLNDDLIRFLSPWAFDQSAEITLGGAVYASSIVDFVDRRDAVEHVLKIALFQGESQTPVEASGTSLEDHYAQGTSPGQVLVSAAAHHIDVVPESGEELLTFIGINYMKIELDFVVGA